MGIARLRPTLAPVESEEDPGTMTAIVVVPPFSAVADGGEDSVVEIEYEESGLGDGVEVEPEPVGVRGAVEEDMDTVSVGSSVAT
jgi:hypothetical protein